MKHYALALSCVALLISSNALAAEGTLPSIYGSSYFANANSPCANGNCSLANSNTFVAASNETACANGNCSLSFNYAPESNSVTQFQTTSPCANGNCLVGNSATQTCNVATTVNNSPCANGQCSLNYGSTPTSTFVTQWQDASPCANGNCSLVNSATQTCNVVTTVNNTPCANGQCSLSYAYTPESSFVTQSQSASPCANGNCLLANSRNRSAGFQGQLGKMIALSSQASQVTESVVPTFPFNHFVAQPVHDVASQPVKSNDPPWVQPESEILDSQPGVDPLDVGCGPEPENKQEEIIFEVAASEPVVAHTPVPTTDQYGHPSQYTLEAPVSAGSQFGAIDNGHRVVSVIQLPAAASGGCATGNCPLMSSY